MTKAVLVAFVGALAHERNLLADVDADEASKDMSSYYCDQKCSEFPDLHGKSGFSNLREFETCATNSYHNDEESHEAEVLTAELHAEHAQVAYTKGCAKCDIDHCSKLVHDFFYVSSLNIELCAATALKHCHVVYLKDYKNAKFWESASGCPAVDHVVSQRLWQSAQMGPLSPDADYNDAIHDVEGEDLEATADWVGGYASGALVPEAMKNLNAHGNIWQNLGAHHLSTTQLQYSFCAYYTPKNRKARYQFCKEIAHDEDCHGCPWNFVNCDGYLAFKDDGAPRRCTGGHACQHGSCKCYSGSHYDGSP
jgi:hypothetical protein